VEFCVAKSVAKPVGEMTDGEIADAWGKAKRAADADDKRISALKEEFVRRSLSYAKGQAFHVFKSVSDETRFDVREARAKAPEFVKQFEKASTRTAFLVKPIEG
jgi:hypothetical protein